MLLLCQMFSFDRCVSRLLEMQSDEYINGCASFRRELIQSKNLKSQNSERINSTGNGTPHHMSSVSGAEKSLNLQDVSAYYSPWDAQNRQLYLASPALNVLTETWKETGRNLGLCDSSNSMLLPELPYTHSEENIAVYLSKKLEPVAKLRRLPLNGLENLVNSLILSYTGNDGLEKCSIFAII